MKTSEQIVFGGGCFWCIEAIFRRVEGVVSVESGYAGGTTPNPSYEHIGDHAEVVRVEYDPDIVELETLLAMFFAAHDPTSVNRQGADVGTQYRSVVLTTSEQQRTTVEAIMKKLIDSGEYSQPIVTVVVPLETFYPAEAYHQRYYEQQRAAVYCRLVINPKLDKLRSLFASKMKGEDG